ncbi:MAG: tandem-95 repeat protein [Nanoarchaeota archaeon]
MLNSSWKIIIAATIILLISIAGAAEPKADAAYIVKSNNGVNSALLSEISALGYTYEIILEENVKTTDLSNYRMIVIGNERLNDPESIGIENHKTMILSSFNYYRTRLLDYQFGWSRSVGSKSSPTKLGVKNRNSEIVSGISSEFNAYKTQGTNIKTAILKGEKPKNIDIIVYAQSLDSDAVVATLKPGDKLLNGKTLQHRGVFFGITEAQYWTPETKKLFENSIKWLLIGEDFDKDGFHSDVDCNDRDSTVFPGAVEIPYDGVDQDCSGEDLKDVDNDGFDAEITGGQDCNDLNPVINPNNPDVFNNCLNDPPVVDDISNKMFREKEVVSIVVGAIDPEGDSLTYTINDNRFIKNGNVFSWQTTQDDKGSYQFNVHVSDGEFSVNKNFGVEIANLNRAPIQLSPIPNFSFDEDSSFILDVKGYFEDGDEDMLFFGIDNTSSDKKISASYEGNGIFRFASEKDFFGEDWIVFWVSDLEDSILSNKIDIKVNSVNDEVVFNGHISDLGWNEDNDLNNAINLRNYFGDADSILDFSVSGNDKIKVLINDGVVSFSPEKDFFGEEEIQFSATDGEFSASSNNINLNVVNTGEPPIFEELNCDRKIQEDKIYSCIVDAVDPDEGKNVKFSSNNQKNMHCEFNGNELRYRSFDNYYGKSSCSIIASDGKDFSNYLFEVDVLAVNDAPAIVEHTPKESSLILKERESKLFSIYASDIDSNPYVSWMVNGQNKLSGLGFEEFVFSEPVGEYIVEAVVSDSSITTATKWNVLVRELSDFSCREIGGLVCSNKEICSGESLSANDTNTCCMSKCAPRFDDAKSCTTLENNLKIEIKDPKAKEKIKLGELLEINVDVKNNLTEDLDLRIKAYLYNLDKDESISDGGSNLKVDTKKSKSLDIEIDIPEEIEFDDKYALFVKAVDDACSQDYILVDIERPKDKISIDSFEIENKKINCGESTKASVKIENSGTDDQDVRIFLANGELKIDEKSDEFELEEFGKDDKTTRDFIIDVPLDAEPGFYNIDLSAVYGSNKENISERIEVECAKKEVTESDFSAPPLDKKIQLNYQKEKRNYYPLIIFLSFSFILLFCFVILSVIAKKRKKTGEL